MVSTQLISFVLQYTFQCLSVPVAWKNPLFGKVFPTMDALANVMTTAELHFCTGLEDVVDSDSPPGLEWFKLLPTDRIGVWGVYVLVFEKPGYPPILYCGSATATKTGVDSRWMMYERQSRQLQPSAKELPTGVLKAFTAGYTITHKGLLVALPIPPPADRPKHRLLMYALEAMFTCAFWMLKSHDFPAYQPCCLWSLEDFTYLGACSHVSVSDVVHDVSSTINLTPDELAALAAATRAREREVIRLYSVHKRQRAIAHDPEAYRTKNRQQARKWAAANREHLRTIKAKWVSNNIDKVREYARDYRAANRENVNKKRKEVRAASPERFRNYSKKNALKTVASERFKCDICNTVTVTQWALDKHYESSTHLKRVEDIKNGKVYKHWCGPCRYGTDDKSMMTRHKKSEKHEQRV